MHRCRDQHQRDEEDVECVEGFIKPVSEGTKGESDQEGEEAERL